MGNIYFLSIDGRVYSTQSMSEVSPTNGAFVAWKAQGNAPLPWPGAVAADQTAAAIHVFLMAAATPAI